jgi:hypothetical protein
MCPVSHSGKIKNDQSRSYWQLLYISENPAVMYPGNEDLRVCVQKFALQ